MDNPAVQSIITIVLYVLRILVPLFSIIVVYKCFTSLKRGRRPEDPVIILEEMTTHAIFPVLYWENSIGRSKSCDIVLPDATASRDHAVLMRRESGWLVTDTGSKSGTFVNGKKVKETTPVFPGDVIAMGSTAVMLKRTSDTKQIKLPKRRVRQVAHPFRLMLLTTWIQLMLFVQACLAEGGFTLLPLLPFLAILVIEWGMYIFSRRYLGRVSFELETIGFLLSGIGIMLVSGTRVKSDDVEPIITTFFSSEMKSIYVQVGALLIGVILFCFLIWFLGDLERVMKWRIPIAIAAIGLFALTLVIGKTIHGSKNWIILGPVSIQPSELIKIAFIFVGASTLDRLQTKENLTGFILFGAACMGFLFLQKDFGTACIFFMTFIIIAFMRSGSVRTIALICSAAVFGVFLILQFKPYVAQRFAVWGHVWEYANEGGYQQTRVLSYSASGGLFGLGLGNGYLGGGQSGKGVFAGNSDLVFGMICEELGILLALVVVVSIALLLFYARSDVTRSRSTFYSISACAAAGMMLFQTCLNVFGATDIFPLTGVTLPFISLGGSSMVAVWGLLAFIKASDERTYAARRKSG